MYQQTRLMSNEEGQNASDQFLNEKQVAELTGISISTLRQARMKKEGIPYMKVGKKLVRYRLSEVINYMDSKRVETK